MLSIIIPTINEEKNIGLTIQKLGKIFSSIKFEILIVDDQSSDNTINEVTKFKEKYDIKIISNKEPKGLGYALLLGHHKATGDFIMFLDADLSIDQYDILNLYNEKIYNGMTIGSRYISKSQIINASKTKAVLSKFLNYLISKYFKLTVIDISHSFRIIHKNVKLKNISCTHPGFFWEITINANLDNYEISEIPIKFFDREYGISKNKTLKMIASVFKSIKNLRNIKKIEK